ADRCTRPVRRDWISTGSGTWHDAAEGIVTGLACVVLAARSRATSAVAIGIDRAAAAVALAVLVEQGRVTGPLVADRKQRSVVAHVAVGRDATLADAVPTFIAVRVVRAAAAVAQTVEIEELRQALAARAAGVGLPLAAARC